ncbi:MAG: hypothetical protein LIO37_04875 [Clostridiales bacterium]|nr:hypothetical protein [Clostridiales bacterium]
MRKGVYTIEAAIWTSMLLMIFMVGIQCGLDLYSEIAEAEVSESVQEYWAVNSFYYKSLIADIIGNCD